MLYGRRGLLPYANILVWWEYHLTTEIIGNEEVIAEALWRHEVKKKKKEGINWMFSEWGDIISKSFVMNKRFMCCILMRVDYNISKALVMAIL